MEQRRSRQFAVMVMLGFGLWFTGPAAAQPDFSSAFAKLDRNGDGVLTRAEFKLEGVEAQRYAAPVGQFETDDGYGVEIWNMPFGIHAVSMAIDLLKTREHMRSRTYLRDRDPMIPPGLLAVIKDGLSLDQFEESVRRQLNLTFPRLDLNGDGGISAAEVGAIQVRNEELRNPGFQNGAGGDAMRALKRKLTLENYAAYDFNGDAVATIDEILESWLERAVGAYVPAS